MLASAVAAVSTNSHGPVHGEHSLGTYRAAGCPPNAATPRWKHPDTNEHSRLEAAGWHMRWPPVGAGRRSRIAGYSRR